MRISWIKISSRIVVVAIIYLLLSIPDSKFQGVPWTGETNELATPFTYQYITKHVHEVSQLTHNEKVILQDTLLSDIGARILSLRSELFSSDSKVIDLISSDLGLVTAIISTSEISHYRLLENLWLWRQLIKEQSLFWNLSSDEIRLQCASALNFVNLCEDFLVTNREIEYTTTDNPDLDVTSITPMKELRSGDIIVSSEDTTYPFYGLSKAIPNLIPSLGLISQKDDTIFYITTTPTSGLEIRETQEFLNKPLATRTHLRLRGDLPELLSNPKIPQLAADFAYDYAKKNITPYDFLLQPISYGAVSEIELLKFVYDGQNSTFVTPFSPILEENKFSLSSLGINGFGQAVTSDIQYHPSITYVSISRNGLETKKRNLEYAAEMACLSKLDHDLIKSLKWDLPRYRLLNGISRVLKLINGNTIIPSGMASETALIYDYLTDQKSNLIPLLEKEVDTFKTSKNYYPTYSETLVLAKTILAN